MSLPEDFEVRVGDALEELQKLPEECVQTCVTSPPYWGLRDYGVESQIGLEPTPEEYVERLVEVFREVRRVLREDGTLWLNLGDSYAGSWGAQGRDGELSERSHISEQQIAAAARQESGTGSTAHLDLKPKDMVGIPWRVAFALQADGWWLRSDIIWHKPNPMPESVTDRPTSSHEHIFLLAKNERYYYDHEAIKEDMKPESRQRYEYEFGGKKNERLKETDKPTAVVGEREATSGRNKRDVWEVTTKPYPDAHFAVYPPELIVPCVKAGTSQRGQCVECGAPWERVVLKSNSNGDSRREGTLTGKIDGDGSLVGDNMFDHGERGSFNAGDEGVLQSETAGWTPTCDCDADTEPQLVLDPFAGAGTTGVVCTELGRRFLGVELNPDYAEMARRRIMDTNPTLFRDTA